MSEPQQEKGTVYVVLRRAIDREVTPTTFSVVDQPFAVSAREAVKAVAKEDGTYVAIPARSWKLTKVTVEPKQTVKLG
jgi:hypothetical protein